MNLITSCWFLANLCAFRVVCRVPLLFSRPYYLVSTEIDWVWAVCTVPLLLDNTIKRMEYGALTAGRALYCRLVWTGFFAMIGAFAVIAPMMTRGIYSGLCPSVIPCVRPCHIKADPDIVGIGVSSFNTGWPKDA